MAVSSSVHTPSVMTDRPSDQSGAALRDPLLRVSIRSAQTIHTFPEPTIAFLLYHHFPSIHLFTALELPSFLFPPKLWILKLDPRCSRALKGNVCNLD